MQLASTSLSWALLGRLPWRSLAVAVAALAGLALPAHSAGVSSLSTTPRAGSAVDAYRAFAGKHVAVRRPRSRPGVRRGLSVTASAFRGRVGVAGATVWHEDDEQRAMLRRARAAGLEWIREDLHWGAFERRPGVWDWTIGDRLMRNAASVGVNVLGVVAYSADWAASGPTIYHPPHDPAAYANFCRKLVLRYGPNGSFWRQNPSLTPRPLTALEIWNEPWLEYFWRPRPNPGRYAALLRAAATAVKVANPTVRVLASGDIFQMRSDTTRSLDWFRPLLQADPELFRSLVDAYSVHAYTQERSPLDEVTPQRWRFDRVLMTRDLAAQARAPHPIWITEFGWSTTGPDAVSESRQALYTRQALERAVSEWGSFVERSFLFYWGKPRGDEAGGYSPIRANGTARPVWDGLRIAAALIRTHAGRLPGRLTAESRLPKTTSLAVPGSDSTTAT